MDNELELQLLLCSQANYQKYLPAVLQSLLTCKTKSQTLKDIFLFCKNSLGVASPPQTKLLVMQFVRDIVERDPSEQTMRLIEQTLLKKVMECCVAQRRQDMGRVQGNQDKSQLKTYEEFTRICLETILVWGKANEHNKASKFLEAFNYLKQKQVKFPAELKYYERRKPPLILSKIDSMGGLSASSVQSLSPTHHDSILPDLAKYDQIKIHIADQLSKSLKNPTYRIDIYKVTHKLNKFFQAFKNRFHYMSPDSSAYAQCQQLHDRVKQLLKRLKHDGLDYRQCVKLIERVVMDGEAEVQGTEEGLGVEEPDYVPTRQFDIFSILENVTNKQIQIHRKIEVEEKKAGLFGNYEFSKQLNIPTQSDESPGGRMKSSFADSKTQENLFSPSQDFIRRGSQPPKKRFAS